MFAAAGSNDTLGLLLRTLQTHSSAGFRGAAALGDWIIAPESQSLKSYHFAASFILMNNAHVERAVTLTGRNNGVSSICVTYQRRPVPLSPLTDAICEVVDCGVGDLQFEATVVQTPLGATKIPLQYTIDATSLTLPTTQLCHVLPIILCEVARSKACRCVDAGLAAAAHRSHTAQHGTWLAIVQYCSQAVRVMLVC